MLVSTKNFAVIKLLAAQRPDRVRVSSLIQGCEESRRPVGRRSGRVPTIPRRLNGNLHLSARRERHASNAHLPLIFHRRGRFVSIHGNCSFGILIYCSCNPASNQPESLSRAAKTASSPSLLHLHHPIPVWLLLPPAAASLNQAVGQRSAEPAPERGRGRPRQVLRPARQPLVL